MFKRADISKWRARADDKTDSLHWHQIIKAVDETQSIKSSTVLLGFSCDEGVRRNHGRPGAKDGPAAIRHALGNLTWHHDSLLFDGGDVICEGQQLEAAQQQLADHITAILKGKARPLIVGGGHEVAWGSFLGLSNYLRQTTSSPRIGIINLDAHFDLRNPKPQANSGTPFRQIAEYCETAQRPFNYLVLGINPLANSKALFEFATQYNVKWRLDNDCTSHHRTSIEQMLSSFLSQIDELYFTICLDVFGPHAAPGVSAPSTIGIEPLFALQLIENLKTLCTQHNVEWRLSDIAEMNPAYDIDHRTARLAAQLVNALI